jgi:hypothetical protein
MSIQLLCFICVDAHTHDHSNHVGKSLKNNKNNATKIALGLSTGLCKKF